MQFSEGKRWMVVHFIDAGFLIPAFPAYAVAARSGSFDSLDWVNFISFADWPEKVVLGDSFLFVTLRSTRTRGL